MTSALQSAEPPRWLRWGFRLLALGLGALHTAVAVRSQSMNEDGIAYLDLGDAWWRGDWDAVINTTWSPLYAWIVGGAMQLVQPSVWWEFPTVQLTNWLIYALALVCFEYFWRQLTRAYVAPRVEQGEAALFPPAIWLAIGYSLFIWVSLNLIAVWAVTPDMCVAALIYLAAGLLLRMAGPEARGSTATWLGLVLGIAYLAKSALFPLGLACMALATWMPGSPLRRWARLGRSLAAFLVVAAPLAVAVSVSVGHPSFGDVGRFAYLKHVNGMPWPQWQEAANRLTGRPEHPPRQIHDDPPAWEFATPVGGTYPLAYDPAWWTQGLKPIVALRPQLKTLVDNTVYYFDLFLRQQGGVLAIALLLGILSWPVRWRGPALDVPLVFVLWALAALGLYALVYAESRYVAPFVLLLWAGLLARIRLPAGDWQRRIMTAAGGLMAIFIWVNIGAMNLEGLGGLIGYASQRHGPMVTSVATRNLSDGGDKAQHPAIAEALRTDFGLEPGTPVAFIGYSYSAYWARLAGLRIVAEIHPEDTDRFWSTDPSRQAGVLRAFRDAGARAVVAEPSDPSIMQARWLAVGRSGYIVQLLGAGPS